MPQFELSFTRSTHTPLQVVCPVGQPQALLTQACPPEHGLPQKPQLSASLAVSVQPVPHCVVSIGQLATHIVWWQYGMPAWHIVPQAPQLAPSDARFTHLSPHGVRPPVHVHMPAVQLCPVPHFLPHIPQLLKSVAVLMQVPPQ
jgi:hypothetical protein